MPKLITTHARIVDEGHPHIVVIGAGFGGPEVVNDLPAPEAQTAFFHTINCLIIARPNDGEQ
jgi:NADH:ubiquinone reductase (H+-translocating)